VIRSVTVAYRLSEAGEGVCERKPSALRAELFERTQSVVIGRRFVESTTDWGGSKIGARANEVESTGARGTGGAW
jgi:hypothetical protein